MKKKPVFPGMRFGRLLVLSEAPRNPRSPGNRVWLCECTCGNHVEHITGVLNSGSTKSCGCLKAERDLAAGRAPRHRLSATVEYRIWKGIKTRCRNPRNHTFANYGARGITLAPEWQDFAAFYHDLGVRPSPAHSVERIDNDGPYSPENCRWATPLEQESNSRRNHILTWQGRSQHLSAWARELGIPVSALRGRIHHGWSIERALTTPLRRWPKSRAS